MQRFLAVSDLFLHFVYKDSNIFRFANHLSIGSVRLTLGCYLSLILYFYLFLHQLYSFVRIIWIIINLWMVSGSFDLQSNIQTWIMFDYN